MLNNPHTVLNHNATKQKYLLQRKQLTSYFRNFVMHLKKSKLSTSKLAMLISNKNCDNKYLMIIEK